MIPILFEYNETEFKTHGLGDLIECTECKSSVEDSGQYELQFKYPMNGELFEELTINRIVVAKVNHYDDHPQAFRIYGYEKSIDGSIIFNCQHISYDLVNVPVKVFTMSTSSTCQDTLTSMKNNAISVAGANLDKYSFVSDVTETCWNQKKRFKLDGPKSVRGAILDGDDSIQGCFGGDLIFDNYTVKLARMGGENRGVVIEYGVDLMDMDQEENISEMITGVLPYYRYHQEDNSDEDVYAYGSVQYASGTFEMQNVQPLDLTSYFPNQERQTAPSAAELNNKAQEWIKAEKIGEPEVTLTLKYASLGQDVRLHDQVTVKFVKMGVDVAAKVTKYSYDVLAEICTEISVGKAKKTVLFSLEDASRLKKGLLPPERIQTNSITSDKYSPGSVNGTAIDTASIHDWHIEDEEVTTRAIRDEAVETEKIKPLAVTTNRIKDGAIITDKIEDGAIIEDKILDKAVAYAKLSEDLQVTITDILAANAIFSGVIQNDGSISTSVITISNYLGLNGDTFKSGTFYVYDHDTTYELGAESKGVWRTFDVYDGAGYYVGGGGVTDAWLQYGLSGTPNTVTNELHTIVKQFIE